MTFPHPIHPTRPIHPSLADVRKSTFWLVVYMTVFISWVLVYQIGECRRGVEHGCQLSRTAVTPRLASEAALTSGFPAGGSRLFGDKLYNSLNILSLDVTGSPLE